MKTKRKHSGKGRRARGPTRIATPSERLANVAEWHAKKVAALEDALLRTTSPARMKRLGKLLRRHFLIELSLWRQSRDARLQGT